MRISKEIVCATLGKIVAKGAHSQRLQCLALFLCLSLEISSVKLTTPNLLLPLLSSNSFRKTDAIFLQVEASTRTHINETRHAHLDQLHDSAVTLNQVSQM